MYTSKLGVEATEKWHYLQCLVSLLHRPTAALASKTTSWIKESNLPFNCELGMVCQVPIWKINRVYTIVYHFHQHRSPKAEIYQFLHAHVIDLYNNNPEMNFHFSYVLQFSAIKASLQFLLKIRGHLSLITGSPGGNGIHHEACNSTAMHVLL